MSERDPAHDPAKARWMILQMVRWTGVGMFVFGLLIYAGKIDLPPEVSWVMMAVGLLDALFMPSVLARMWKTPL